MQEQDWDRGRPLDDPNEPVPKIEPQPHPARTSGVNAAKGVAPPQYTRTTLLLKLYHQIPYNDPVGPQIPAYTEVLENEERPYERHLKVGEDWTPIDFGWTAATGCSFLCVRNEYRAKRSVQPTIDEEQDDLLHILEIGKVIKAMRPYLKPGEPDHVEPLLVLYVGQPVVLSVLGQADWVIRRRPGFDGRELNAGQYMVFCVPNDPD